MLTMANEGGGMTLPLRVRQGLGLLALAAILWLVLLMLANWQNDWKYLVLGTPTLACLFGGLGMLAYGLLRGR